MLEPTSGRVMIQGLDNQVHIEEIRHNLGFCPQYGTNPLTKELPSKFSLHWLDILYDELSVQEHLELIGKVRTSEG
jgi:ABC-type Na+ transport system ATPase subunit NatA